MSDSQPYVLATLVDGFWRHWYTIEAKSRKDAMQYHRLTTVRKRTVKADLRLREQPVMCVADPFHVLYNGDCIPPDWNKLCINAMLDSSKERETKREMLRVVIDTTNREWEAHQSRLLDAHAASIRAGWTSVDTSVE